MIDSSLFGKRLKELRESKGLSHQKLSAALSKKYGISISTDSLQNYEVTEKNHSRYNKNAGMRVEYLYYLSDFYGVSTDYLLGCTSNRGEKRKKDPIIPDPVKNYIGTLPPHLVKMLEDANDMTCDEIIGDPLPLPCPFCGSELIGNVFFSAGELRKIYRHPDNKPCILSDYEMDGEEFSLYSSEVSLWNQRYFTK